MSREAESIDRRENNNSDDDDDEVTALQATNDRLLLCVDTTMRIMFASTSSCST